MKHLSLPDLQAEYDPPRNVHSDQVVQALMRASLFGGMEAVDVAAVLRDFDEERFDAGHRITLEGMRGSDFFVIVDGHARVSVADGTVAHLNPGDFFGEVGVLGDGLRIATVTAETPLRCLVLPHRRLERVLVDHPQMSVNILREVVGRFRNLAERTQPSLSSTGGSRATKWSTIAPQEHRGKVRRHTRHRAPHPHV